MTFKACLASAFTPSISWFLAVLIIGMGGLLLAAPGSGRRVKRAAVTAVASVAGLLLTAVLRFIGADVQAFVFQAAQGLSHFLLSAAAIHACGVLAFDLLLPGMRMPLSALVQDLILAAAYAAAAMKRPTTMLTLSWVISLRTLVTACAGWAPSSSSNSSIFRPATW